MDFFCEGFKEREEVLFSLYWEPIPLFLLKAGGNIPTFTNSPKEIGKWIVESNWTYLPPWVCFVMFYLFGMLEGCCPSRNSIAM